MKVSIALVCYNHADYVTRAIQGIVEQQGLESFEIVIADDASTDETLIFVEEAFAKSSIANTVRYLPPEPNMGVTANYRRIFASCRGEYIAIIEGDDYWTDPLKLQRQIAALDCHRYAPAAGHNYLIRDEAQARFTVRLPDMQQTRIMDAGAIVEDNVPGNFSAMMYRSSAVRELPAEIYDVKAYDWLVNICLALHGPIVILPEVLSVYRIHGGGSWSRLSHVQKLQEQIDILPTYDRLTGSVLSSHFEELRRRLQLEVQMQRSRALLDGNSRAIPGKLFGTVPFTRSTLQLFLPPFFLVLLRWVVPPVFPILLFAILKRIKKVRQ